MGGGEGDDACMFVLLVTWERNRDTVEKQYNLLPARTFVSSCVVPVEVK